jgi:hypothetical protein
MTGLLTPQRQTAGNGLLDQAPRRVDDRVAGLLGLDPSIQRGAILPFGRDASGEMVMAWPEMALDTLKSLMLPGHVVQGGEFTPRDVTEMALDMGMLSSVAPAPAGAKRMFGGISAKNAPLDDLAKAEAMEKAGEAADDIWRATGWGRGAEGKWRFEIDDSGAVGRDYQLTPQEAFERAKTDALISGDPAARARTELMKPYATKSTAEMLDEYRRTGGEIVAAAERGDMDQALRLQESRAGLDATFDNMRSNYGPVSSYLKHDELGAAYPDVYAMHTRISPDDLSGGARGQYFRGDPGRSEQVLLKEAPTWSQPRSTTLHELQHAVQQREGFARGGSPTAFVQEAKAKLADLDQQVAWINEQLRLSVGTPDYNRFLDMREDVRKKMRAVEGGSPNGRAMGVMEQANDQYRALAGEVEARNVQSRMDMDAATRRATPPWSTEDVPRDQQIVRGLLSGDGPQMSASLPMDEASRMARAEADKFEVARQNAARSVEDGGLGLYDGSEPVNRAIEMGFDDRNILYHQTKDDIKEFKLNADAKSHSGGGAVWLRDDPRYSLSAHQTWKDGEFVSGTNEMPVIIKPSGELPVKTWSEMKRDGKLNPHFPQVVTADENKMIRDMGFTHARVGGEVAVFDPSVIRSRFAAFDPARKDSTDILASYLGVPGIGMLDAMPQDDQSRERRGLLNN